MPDPLRHLDDTVLGLLEYALRLRMYGEDAPGGKSETWAKWERMTEAFLRDHYAEGDSRCCECGRDNPVWSAPNELWNSVMGSPDGILCPTCFIRRADTGSRVFEVRVAWDRAGTDACDPSALPGLTCAECDARYPEGALHESCAQARIEAESVQPVIPAKNEATR